MSVHREAAKDRARASMQEVADSLKDLVEKIEGGIATTQNHYGDYMNIIGAVSKGDRESADIIAQALILAGANERGVSDALRVSF